MLGRIGPGIRGALANPRRTARLLRTRVFAADIILSDPDAYQVMGSYTYGKLPRVELSQLFPGVERLDLSICKPFATESATSLSASELLAVAAIARMSNARRIVEVGTFNGVTTLNLAANSSPDARVSTIDLPPDWGGALGLDVPDDMKNVTPRDRVGFYFRDTPLSGKIHQVFDDSAVLDWSRLDGPFDLAFIDGCHTFDYVVRDTENARANLTPGGILVWHDYGIIEDVSRAVDQCASDLNPSAIRGTRLAVARTNGTR